MRRLLIKPRARLDLLEIWHHIAQNSIPAANRISEELDAAIFGLIAMPGKGHTRPDVKDVRIRFWSLYSYMIAYRYDDHSLTIIRVLHGRRNFRKLFPSKK